MMNESQFQGILKVLSGIKERSPFYAKKFEGIDLNQIKSQEDFEKLPFSNKSDLREAYPLGLQAVPEEEIVRILPHPGPPARRLLSLIPGRMCQTGRKCSSGAMKPPALLIWTESM